MGTRQFQDKTSRHLCYQLELWDLSWPLTLLLNPCLIQLVCWKRASWLELTLDQSWSAPIPKHHNKKMITHSTRLGSFSVCFLCSAAFAEKAAEHRKHTENDPKCVELGKRCILLAVESYGPGDQRQRAFSQVATRFAIRGNTLKSKVVAKLYGRLSLLLVRANARSILVRSHPQRPQQENDNEVFT